MSRAKGGGRSRSRRVSRRGSTALPEQRRLLAVEPWSASGPGWSNAGVRAWFEVTRFELRDGVHHAVTRVESDCLYAHEMTAEEHLGFAVALTALAPFNRRFEAALRENAP